MNAQLNFDSGTAMRRSQANAMEKPPPAAAPAEGKAKEEKKEEKKDEGKKAEEAAAGLSSLFG